jgi:uncharacterized coiled-coil DUF342 family protein
VLKPELVISTNLLKLFGIQIYSFNREENVSQKDAYIQKLQARLHEWDKEVDRLATKAIKAKADAKLEYYEQIEELRDKQDVAIEKLEKLRQASDDIWEDLKAGIESAWNDLSEAVKSASSRFK